MVLSNITENGKPIGLADAGQDWHTDMSYVGTSRSPTCSTPSVPRRNGKALGDTEFRLMHAAYEDLPADIKGRLEGTALHDFAKFWDMMRARTARSASRSRRSSAQEAAGVASGVPHPPDHRPQGVVLQSRLRDAHRWLPEGESDELLAFLFKHQVQPKYCYAHRGPKATC